MVRKGVVDSIANGKVTVWFPDMDNVRTPELPVIQSPFTQVNQELQLQINDIVYVLFWGNNMMDGIVIGRE